MVLIAIDLHMVIIEVHVGQNIVDDVLLDKGSITLKGAKNLNCQVDTSKRCLDS
jgi:hypothetical protein